MKNNKTIGLLVFAAAAVCCLTGCKDKSENPIQDTFDFSAVIAGNHNTLVKGRSYRISVLPNDVSADFEPSYVYESSNKSVATVDTEGNISAIAEGKVTFTVTEEQTWTSFSITDVPVVEDKAAASGGFNYASATGDEAIAKRTEILGKLEKYAMDTHLTGITLFENGGFVKYSERAYDNLPTKNYITGYGFGILSEGAAFTKSLPNGSEKYANYYHSAQSQDPLTINALNATGSQVGDLAGYITSGFWGTKMNEAKNGYEWYPVLAKDKVGEKANSYPVPVGELSELGLYKGWKIYVKTGASDGIAYRAFKKNPADTDTTINDPVPNPTYDKKKVALADYEFAFKLLLTGSNKLKRGAEMAGDTSYGIKGAQRFYNQTKNITDVTQINNIWNDMKTAGTLGIQTGSDTNGEYIQLELLNPIDEFTAMYTLSSSLYSPIPEQFILDISDDGTYASGAKKYGNFNSTGHNGILNNVICCGPYYLNNWYKKQQTVFSLNEDWFEAGKNGRYNIKGVAIRVIDTSNDEEAVWKAFNNGELDSAGIPTKQITAQKTAARVLKTKGDSTFKLNVNSCNQEFWNSQFGANGKICKNSTWNLKPWMANDNFLKGLFFSINRKQFAEKRGVNPSIDYFSDAYLSDPQKGYSYNDTEAHKEAVKAYQSYGIDENGNEYDAFGYDFDAAVNYFKVAVSQLVKNGDIQYGSRAKPTEINIHIRWMYQTDVNEYGEDIAKYFQDAFNHENVSQGKVKLVVKQEAVTNWEDVYNEWMMKGQFDLAFGAISGNTYNPLNFLEVLKSNNSSGFTLNWGNDTSKVDDENLLIYDGKKWSFDALYEVADHGGVVENGVAVKTVKSAYMDGIKNLSNKTTADLTNGGTFDIRSSFVDVGESATFSFDATGAVKCYVVGAGSFDLPYEVRTDNKGTYLRVTISAELAQEINDKIRETYKLRQEDDNAKWQDYTNMLKTSNYGVYWTVEIYYNISILGEAPSQNYTTIEKNSTSHDFIKDE